MKYAVVGSRDLTGCNPIVESIIRAIRELDPDGWVVSDHGCTIGLAAEKEAARQVVPYLIFPARWINHGKLANLMRNVQIAQNSDACICIYNGTGRDAKHIMSRFDIFGKPVLVIDPGGMDYSAKLRSFVRVMAEESRMAHAVEQELLALAKAEHREKRSNLFKAAVPSRSKPGKIL